MVGLVLETGTRSRNEWRAAPVLALALGLLAGCGGGDPSAGTPAPAASQTPAPGTPTPAPRAARGARVAKPPEIRGLGRVVIDWQRWRNPPIRVVVGIGGVATGLAGTPLVPRLFPGPERAEDAHYLSRRYAPFRARMASGEMIFYGRGRVRPVPAEERMIVEWARRVAAELAGGRSGGSYGLALSWHRGVSVGSCESVSVFLTGEAQAGACAWGSDEVRGRLQPEALDRLYGWYDSLKAFQSSQVAGEETEPSRLVFAGRGSRAPAPEEGGQIEAFAATLFRELALRRRGSAQALSAAATATPTPAPAGRTTPAEPSAGPRLLLPAERLPVSPPLAPLGPRVPPPVPSRDGRTGF